MNLTNKQIIASSNAMSVLSQVALPVKTSFAVAKSGRAIRDALTLIQSEREKLIDKHAQKDDAGDRKQNEDGSFPLADPVAYRADETALLDIEQDINFDPLGLDDLGQVSIPASVFIDLDWLFSK